MPRKTTITENSLRSKRDALCNQLVRRVERANKRGAELAMDLEQLQGIANQFKAADQALAKFRGGQS